MLGILNDIEIRNILSSQFVGRLACTNGKQPYIVPVTYTYDGQFIYGQTNEGMKLNMLRENSNVCFEVDSIQDMRNWKSVIVSGKFEELDNEEAKNAKDILFEHVFPLTTSSTIHYSEDHLSEPVENSNRLKNVMYRIKIENITGRFEKG